jgi:hypothetical protein
MMRTVSARLASGFRITRRERGAMKNTKRMFQVVVSAAILLAVGTAGADSQQFNLSRQSASAGFVSDDSDPCIVTNASALGSQSIVRVPGDPSTASAGTFIHYTSFNGCTQDFIQGFALGGPDTFSITNNLNAATLTVPLALSSFVFDPETGTYTETPLGTATMTVQWTGVGNLDHTKLITVTQLDFIMIKVASKGKFRDATVQATLNFGGQNLLAGLSTAGATLGDVTFGQLTVIHR